MFSSDLILLSSHLIWSQLCHVISCLSNVLLFYLLILFDLVISSYLLILLSSHLVISFFYLLILSHVTSFCYLLISSYLNYLLLSHLMLCAHLPSCYRINCYLLLSRFISRLSRLISSYPLIFTRCNILCYLLILISCNLILLSFHLISRSHSVIFSSYFSLSHAVLLSSHLAYRMSSHLIWSSHLLSSFPCYLSPLISVVVSFSYCVSISSSYHVSPSHLNLIISPYLVILSHRISRYHFSFISSHATYPVQNTNLWLAGWYGCYFLMLRI